MHEGSVVPRQLVARETPAKSFPDPSYYQVNPSYYQVTPHIIKLALIHNSLKFESLKSPSENDKRKERLFM